MKRYNERNNNNNNINNVDDDTTTYNNNFNNIFTTLPITEAINVMKELLINEGHKFKGDKILNLDKVLWIPK